MSDGSPDQPRVLVIAGPTASGKSALAMRLASRLDGIIINADSMQVYRDLRVLTARPSVADELQVRHALYGVVDGADAFSVSRWLEALSPVLKQAKIDGRVAIVVGGSGLYLKALTQGLSPIPIVPAEVRSAVRAWAAERTPTALHAELKTIDPQTAARLHPTDPQRLIRAIEVKRATGCGLADYHRERAPPLIESNAYRAVSLAVPRPQLHQRAEHRFNDMLVAGATAEAETLSRRNLPNDLPIMRTIGLGPLIDHVEGRSTLADAVKSAQDQTRYFVKRQTTFFRTQLAGFVALKPEAAEQYLFGS